MTNPYAPTTSLNDDELRDATSVDPTREIIDRPPYSLARSFVTWSLVCSIAAIPSFYLGFAITRGFAGMLTGVAIFIAAYIATDRATYSHPFRQSRIVRRVLRITYATRILITIAFPVGMFLDMVCGMIAIPLGTMNFDWEDPGRSTGSVSFLAAVLTTLIQGVLLNIVLGVYAAILLGLGFGIRALRRR